MIFRIYARNAAPKARMRLLATHVGSDWVACSASSEHGGLVSVSFPAEDGGAYKLEVDLEGAEALARWLSEASERCRRMLDHNRRWTV